jgi:DnaJ-like protein/PASTA domain-containing protein
LTQPGKGPVVTWYDVLGVLPGASAEHLKSQHDAKASLVRPELVAGAPSPVVLAATRAREILDAAWRVLADPASRAIYDQATGIRRDGGGLTRRDGFPSGPRPERGDGLIGGIPGAELLGALLALGESRAPHPGPSRWVTVPDVRGLFFSVCLGIAGKLGLRVSTVRLTARPRPVDGLVVAQSPGPAARARRGSPLTVQVWHPPARSVVAGQVIR